MLDMGTGGGEALAGLADRAPRTVATEGWPPNVPLAAQRLRPLGIPVIQNEAAADNMDQDGADDGGRLPFRGGSLDLICYRHESFLAAEVSRVLAPGGTFVTQRVMRRGWIQRGRVRMTGRRSSRSFLTGTSG